MALDPCDGHKAEGIWNDPCCPHCPVPSQRFHGSELAGLRPGEIAVQLTPPGLIAYTEEELSGKPFGYKIFCGEPDRFPSNDWTCIGCDLEFDITPEHPAPAKRVCGACLSKRPMDIPPEKRQSLWDELRGSTTKVLDTD